MKPASEDGANVRDGPQTEETRSGGNDTNHRFESNRLSLNPDSSGGPNLGCGTDGSASSALSDCSSDVHDDDCRSGSSSTGGSAGSRSSSSVDSGRRDHDRRVSIHSQETNQGIATVGSAGSRIGSGNLGSGSGRSHSTCAIVRSLSDRPGSGSGCGLCQVGAALGIGTATCGASGAGSCGCGSPRSLEDGGSSLCGKEHQGHRYGGRPELMPSAGSGGGLLLVPPVQVTGQKECVSDHAACWAGPPMVAQQFGPGGAGTGICQAAAMAAAPQLGMGACIAGRPYAAAVVDEDVAAAVVAAANASGAPCLSGAVQLSRLSLRHHQQQQQQQAKVTATAAVFGHLCSSGLEASGLSQAPADAPQAISGTASTSQESSSGGALGSVAARPATRETIGRALEAAPSVTALAPQQPCSQPLAGCRPTGLGDPLPQAPKGALSIELDSSDSGSDSGPDPDPESADGDDNALGGTRAHLEGSNAEPLAACNGAGVEAGRGVRPEGSPRRRRRKRKPKKQVQRSSSTSSSGPVAAPPRSPGGNNSSRHTSGGSASGAASFPRAVSPSRRLTSSSSSSLHSSLRRGAAAGHVPLAPHTAPEAAAVVSCPGAPRRSLSGGSAPTARAATAGRTFGDLTHGSAGPSPAGAPTAALVLYSSGGNSGSTSGAGQESPLTPLNLSRVHNPSDPGSGAPMPLVPASATGLGSGSGPACVPGSASGTPSGWGRPPLSRHSPRDLPLSQLAAARGTTSEGAAAAAAATGLSTIIGADARHVGGFGAPKPPTPSAASLTRSTPGRLLDSPATPPHGAALMGAAGGAVRTGRSSITGSPALNGSAPAAATTAYPAAAAAARSASGSSSSGLRPTVHGSVNAGAPPWSPPTSGVVPHDDPRLLSPSLAASSAAGAAPASAPRRPSLEPLLPALFHTHDASPGSSAPPSAQQQQQQQQQRPHSWGTPRPTGHAAGDPLESSPSQLPLNPPGLRPPPGYLVEWGAMASGGGGSRPPSAVSARSTTPSTPIPRPPVHLTPLSHPTAPLPLPGIGLDQECPTGSSGMAAEAQVACTTAMPGTAGSGFELSSSLRLVASAGPLCIGLPADAVGSAAGPASCAVTQKHDLLEPQAAQEAGAATRDPGAGTNPQAGRARSSQPRASSTSRGSSTGSVAGAGTGPATHGSASAAVSGKKGNRATAPAVSVPLLVISGSAAGLTGVSGGGGGGRASTATRASAAPPAVRGASRNASPARQSRSQQLHSTATGVSVGHSNSQPQQHTQQPQSQLHPQPNQHAQSNQHGYHHQHSHSDGGGSSSHGSTTIRGAGVSPMRSRDNSEDVRKAQERLEAYSRAQKERARAAEAEEAAKRQRHAEARNQQAAQKERRRVEVYALNALLAKSEAARTKLLEAAMAAAAAEKAAAAAAAKAAAAADEAALGGVPLDGVGAGRRGTDGPSGGVEGEEADGVEEEEEEDGEESDGGGGDTDSGDEDEGAGMKEFAGASPLGAAAAAAAALLRHGV